MQQAVAANRRSVPTAALSRLTATNTIRKMWSRIWIPAHRPRLIGDHSRGSVVMVGPPRRSAFHLSRAVDFLTLYTVAAVKTTRNAASWRPVERPVFSDTLPDRPSPSATI